MRHGTLECSGKRIGVTECGGEPSFAVSAFTYDVDNARDLRTYKGHLEHSKKRLLQ